MERLRRSVAEPLFRHSLFANLAGAVLENLSRASAIVRFRRHSDVFTQGAPVKGLKIVLEGWARTLVWDPEGRSVGLDLWNRDSLPGLDDFFSNGAHEMNCVALNETLVLTVGRDALLHECRESADLSVGIAATMAEYMRRQNAARVDFALATVPRRIARLLLRLAAREGRRENGRIVVDIRLTRIEIAELVDSTTPTVIRTLAEWTRLGWLTMTRTCIALEDEDALRSLAGWEDEDRERLL
ncbi:MAG: Crp/Fnr family transcriptional regulator [Candidatus Methylomirabilis sp.]|nr:Crp/Fnr family transcriptional regulator [Deltaproteobacteria bacterium]